MLNKVCLEAHLKGIRYCMEEIDYILLSKTGPMDPAEEKKLYMHYYEALKTHVNALTEFIKEAEAK